MVDALGPRGKFAVMVPSTNTSVQPDMDDMRPPGVTNHITRISIADDPVDSDADFEALLDNIRAELDNAVDRVMTARPDYFVMGMSAETFWGGLEVSDAFKARTQARIGGIGLAMGSDACRAALKAYGDTGAHGEIRRIAVVTPYWPVGDRNVKMFFEDCGFEVVAIKGLCCKSPMLIGHVAEDELRRVLGELDETGAEAIVQAGTNLSMVRLAAEAERRFKKPVIAINTATYWYALRDHGISDRIDGFGRLLSEFTELPEGHGRAAR